MSLFVIWSLWARSHSLSHVDTAGTGSGTTPTPANTNGNVLLPGAVNCILTGLQPEHFYWLQNVVLLWCPWCESAVLKAPSSAEMHVKWFCIWNLHLLYAYVSDRNTQRSWGNQRLMWRKTVFMQLVLTSINDKMVYPGHCWEICEFIERKNMIYGQLPGWS